MKLKITIINGIEKRKPFCPLALAVSQWQAACLKWETCCYPVSLNHHGFKEAGIAHP
ncbi:hypothetical protein ACNR9V_08960 [Parageobacillus thermoglucosidasius]|uniref:hypothetical protein n=1 Tax=Parageobacillus thermoglucosidasius TaxID=1426 RepID=UPI003B673845